MGSRESVSKKRLLLGVAGLLVAVAAVFVCAQAPEAKQAAQRVPVLVELFTSEGCSDCPPADALLAELDAKQPVPGAEAIVLSEHVTYWNHLGWRDPFSLDAITQRQEEYVRRFGLDSAYTPQMVVDGTSQFVGSDGRSLIAAVNKAAAMPKVRISIEGAGWEHGTVRFAVRGDRASGLKLFAALAANATHSEVSRGENAGRTLHHTAVVQAIKAFSGDVLDGRPLELAGGSPAQATEGRGSIRLVVFLTDSVTGQVRGAAQRVLLP